MPCWARPLDVVQQEKSIHLALLSSMINIWYDLTSMKSADVASMLPAQQAVGTASEDMGNAMCVWRDVHKGQNNRRMDHLWHVAT